MNKPYWSGPVTARIDDRDVHGVIVGKCWHDGREHYDVREGLSRIHADVPAEKVCHTAQPAVRVVKGKAHA